MQSILNAQQNHWESMFDKNKEMFGLEPSFPACYAKKLLQEKNISKLLELGAGQGRDTLFFAQNQFDITALDYTQQGLNAIAHKAKTLNLPLLLCQHDVRQPLPFEDASFEVCFSHMLYCMPLSTAELEFLNEEICRILKPGGYNIYTARHTNDPHYRQGIYWGEDMYEIGGFIVHFFSPEKVKNLTKGFELVKVETFEEGGLPRKLFCVTLQKM